MPEYEHQSQHPLLPPDRFLNFDVPAYLYTGAHAPALASANSAITEGHRLQSRGPAGREALLEEEVDARAAVARLAGRAAEDVAFLGDASTAWNAVANGLRWLPGDNIVINEFEHPSVVLPWLRLKPRGLEVRVVERDQDWQITTEALEAACDERTRGIMISQVGYVSGFRHDLREVTELAERVGAPLFVDASHSLGVVPVDLDGVAIVISASYKWMLGPYGVGIVIWNRDLLPDFEPGSVGWRSTSDIFVDDRFDRLRLDDDARRFQQGAPSLAGIAGLRAAVEELLALGAGAVEQHALALSGSAISTLRGLGLDVITPDDPHRRAGNVAFLHPEGERIAAALAREGVLVWGGDGRVRASFHVMNGTDSIDALSDGLERVFAHAD